MQLPATRQLELSKQRESCFHLYAGCFKGPAESWPIEYPVLNALDLPEHLLRSGWHTLSTAAKMRIRTALSRDWFMKSNLELAKALGDRLQSHFINGIEAGFSTIQDDGSIPESAMLTMLPESVKERAESLIVPEEKRHFLFRRCFQRLFAARLTNWPGAIDALPLLQGLDQCPHCSCAPDLRLSFSSSGPTYVFGGTTNGHLGLDVEHLRPVEHAAALAQRFFSAEEAQIVINSAEPEQSLLFLTIWSAKEAGLKAIGRGVSDGLNIFKFIIINDLWQVQSSDVAVHRAGWQFVRPDWLPQHVIAVLHRPFLTSID
jgi:phosphopantetheine--protein transferase-like protein